MGVLRRLTDEGLIGGGMLREWTVAGWNPPPLPDPDELALPAPTVVATQASVSTIPSAVKLAPTDSRFRHRGGNDFTAGATFPHDTMVRCTSKHPHTWDKPQWTYGVEFMFDGDVFELLTYKFASFGFAIRVKVDGQRTTDLPVALAGGTAGTRHVIRVAFSSAKLRRITLEMSYMAWGGIWIGPAHSVTLPPALTTRWAVLGDSISDGSNENTGNGIGTWVHRAANYLRWDDPWSQAIGSTGYVAETLPDRPKLGSRVAADIIAYNPEKVVVFAGTNDTSLFQQTIGEAAASVYAAIKAGLPAADVFVVGVWTPQPAPAGTVITTDETLRTRALAAGLPFISPITGRVYDSSGVVLADNGPWVTTANRTSVVGADNVHPTNAGHVLIAERISEGIALIEG